MADVVGIPSVSINLEFKQILHRKQLNNAKLGLYKPLLSVKSLSNTYTQVTRWSTSVVANKQKMGVQLCRHLKVRAGLHSR